MHSLLLTKSSTKGTYGLREVLIKELFDSSANGTIDKLPSTNEITETGILET